jgi:light-regulated signal transduction histidine kinase (bacteriophytochrome)
MDRAMGSRTHEMTHERAPAEHAKPYAIMERQIAQPTVAGMPEDRVPRVFDLFTQGEQTLDPAQGALGLALVKRFIHVHGSTVSAARTHKSLHGHSERLWRRAVRLASERAG